MHIESQKVYIGSSINLALRISDHLGSRNSNLYLQRAFAKYGLDKFTAAPYILEFLEDKSLSIDELLIDLVKLEQKYLRRSPSLMTSII